MPIKGRHFFPTNQFNHPDTKSWDKMSESPNTPPSPPPPPGVIPVIHVFTGTPVFQIAQPNLSVPPPQFRPPFYSWVTPRMPPPIPPPPPSPTYTSAEMNERGGEYLKEWHQQQGTLRQFYREWVPTREQLATKKAREEQEAREEEEARRRELRTPPSLYMEPDSIEFGVGSDWDRACDEYRQLFQQQEEDPLISIRRLFQQ